MKHQIALLKALLISVLFLGTGSLILTVSPITSAYAQDDDDNEADDLDDDIEQEIEQTIENQVEQTVEDEISSELDRAIEEATQQEVDENIEAQVEGEVDDEIEKSVEQETESDLEDSIEEELEHELENNIEKTLDQETEESLEDDLEQEIEGDLTGDLDDDIEEETEDSLDDDATDEDLLEEEVDDIEADLNEENDQHDAGDDSDLDEQDNEDLDHFIYDQPITDIDLIIEEDGEESIKGEWLILIEEESIEKLEKSGFRFIEHRRLSGLDMVLGKLSTSDALKLSEEKIQVTSEKEIESLAIDKNHLYSNNSATKTQEKLLTSFHPNQLLQLAESTDNPIGIIDTAVDTQHKAFANCEIIQESFIRGKQPLEHGTAVASILCGQSESYQGLFKRAKIYSASVFFNHPKKGETTSTLAIIQAIDWLVRNKVPVINLSLCGPANTLLEIAVKKAIQRGATIVAAVGNNGPTSPPVYPAAYENVIGVTGISPKTNKVYRLAGRGKHVDVAAPGMDIAHAQDGGGYTSSSGTSFATPFVSALLATHPKEKEKILEEQVIDLGEPGKDQVYGSGLIQGSKPKN